MLGRPTLFKGAGSLQYDVLEHLLPLTKCLVQTAIFPRFPACSDFLFTFASHCLSLFSLRAFSSFSSDVFAFGKEKNLKPEPGVPLLEQP